MNGKDNSMKISIRVKLLLTSIIPLLLLAAVTIFLTSTTIQNHLKNEIKDSLRSTAVATLAAYDQNSGDYLQTANGDVWKGSYNISKSETLVDKIKQDSNMDVTFFYGSTRIMTSARDMDGNRLLGSPAGDVIIEKVLKGEEAYFSETVSLNGVMNYGYYIPVYQRGTTLNPIGMIFVGVNKDEKDAFIRNTLYTLIIRIFIVILIGIFCTILLASNMANALKRSIQSVQKVADRDLNITINSKTIQRKDEIGDLSRAIMQLQKSLCIIIGKLKEHSQTLRTSSYNLDFVAGETIQNLNRNASAMRQFSDKASSTIQELLSINTQVQNTIDLISSQTLQTNSSAQKIQEATIIITSIAEETSLLSLNASIEAARAGDAGRGFSVVAEQIQHLATQSNNAIDSIEQIISNLLDASQQTVHTMKQVTDIVENQNKNISIAESTISEVRQEIEASLQSMDTLVAKTEELNHARIGVIDVMSALSEIANQNAVSTQETNDATIEVTHCFEQVTSSSE